MITKINENLVAVIQSNSTELHDILTKHPNISVIINNCTNTDLLNDDDHNYLVNLDLEHILYIETSIHFEGKDTKMCFSFYYIIDGMYYIITKINLYKIFVFTNETKATLQKAIIAYTMCQNCIYMTKTHLLTCAVNPMYIFDDDNQCMDFEDNAA